MAQIVIAKASAPLDSGRIESIRIEVAANGYVLSVCRAGSGPGNNEVFRGKEELLSRLSEILDGTKQGKGKAKAAPPEEEEPEEPEEEEPEEEE